MENILNGGVEELEEAKRAIIDDAQKNLEADEAAGLLKAKEKELNARKMFMSDKIDSTIKNRRSALEKEHNEKLDTAKKDVKEARRNKKEALSKAVGARIKEEGAELEAEIKRLKREHRALFKAAKIPGFCTTKYYYALFAPRSGADFLIFVVTIIIAVALIPNVVCALFDWRIFYKIILYVAIVVFFALIYFLVTIWTKAGQKVTVLEDGRPFMKQKKAARKELKKLKKAIKKDDNEQQYGLEAYDAEIARREQIFEEKAQAKENALSEFDNYTVKVIRREIEDEIIPQIESLSAELEAAQEDAALKRRIASEAAEYLASNYTVYLGEKYTVCEKIDELIALINEGKAANVSGALEILKGGNK